MLPSIIAVLVGAALFFLRWWLTVIDFHEPLLDKLVCPNLLLLQLMITPVDFLDAPLEPRGVESNVHGLGGGLGRLEEAPRSLVFGLERRGAPAFDIVVTVDLWKFKECSCEHCSYLLIHLLSTY